MAPDGWCSANLDSLARVNPEQLGNRTDPEHLLEYLDIAAIERPGVIGATRTLRFSEAPSRARRLARNGDILVSTVRPYLRNFARIREAPDNLVVSTGYAVVRPGSGVDGRFLYQHILSAGFIDFLKPRMSGSNYPAVTASDVEAYPLSLPPLPEQRKIAAILSSVDDAIEKTQSVIDQAQVVKRGLMQKLLTRGLPGRHTQFKQTEIGLIPDRWLITHLGKILELKRGYDLPRRNRTVGTVPVISSSGEIDTHGEAKVKGPGVVTGRYGSVGQVFFITEAFWPLNTTLYVHDFKGNDPKFVSYFLRGFDFSVYSDKTAIPGLNRNHLHRVTVVFPPDIGEQRTIATILSSVDDTIEENQTIMDRLRVLKTALMSTLLTGELRVTPASEAA